MVNLSTLCAQREQQLFDALREEFPYMNTDKIRDVIRASTEQLKTGIAEQAKPMAASLKRCNFFILPRELRNVIYELALIPQNKHDGGIACSRAIVVCDYRERCASEWVKQPALTKVSKAIRAETLPIFYGMNSFVIRVPSSAAPEPRPPFPSHMRADPEPHLRFASHMRADPKYFDFAGAQHWLRNIGTHNIALLKHLEICLLTGIETVNSNKTGYQRKLNVYLRHWGIVLPRSTKFLAVADNPGKSSWEPVQFSYVTVDTERSELFKTLQAKCDTLATRRVSKDLRVNIILKELEGWYLHGIPIVAGRYTHGEGELVNDDEYDLLVGGEDKSSSRRRVRMLDFGI